MKRDCSGPCAMTKDPEYLDFSMFDREFLKPSLGLLKFFYGSVVYVSLILYYVVPEDWGYKK